MSQESCVTLKAYEGNTFQADSANCATKKSGVFCMKDKLVPTTTTTTTERTTTETPQPNYPGANLPKMPRLCLNQREKREVKGKLLMQFYFSNYLLCFLC